MDNPGRNGCATFYIQISNLDFSPKYPTKGTRNAIANSIVWLGILALNHDDASNQVWTTNIVY